ncbi:OmpA family protein [soil metagenome]
MRTTTTLFLLLMTISVFAQKKSYCPPSENKKAIKYFEQALEAKKSGDGFEKVKTLCNKALEEDSLYADPLQLLGDGAYSAKDLKTMELAYTKLLAVCLDAGEDPYYRLGMYQFDKKKYEAAILTLGGFIDFNSKKEDQNKTASQTISRAKLLMHPVPFNPIPLKNISGPNPEYLAVISPDQDLCFFTRRFEESKKGQLTPVSVEKFMMSKKVNGEFDPGIILPPPFNKSNSNNEGGATISIDNKHLFFTVNKNGNFDIYTSDETKGVWSEPKSIGDKVNDPKQWDSQPCIAKDGKTLYFASFRDTVTQTCDIFVTRKTADGTWSKAEPLSAAINTPGNEKSPFIHPDNKTLYFSSDYLQGMGGYDIFMSKLKADGTWSQPVNIGYPINTEADELGFFVSTDGKKGYYSSNNLKGAGGYDVYEFELPENAKPDRVLFIKGDLKDENHDAIPGATIELKNTATQDIIEVNYDTISGQFASVVLFDDDYIMTVKKQGYAFNSEYLSTSDSSISEPKKVDIELRKTEVGKAYTLNNILFEYNSTALNKQDQFIITDFADYLNLNPSLRVSIQGHTDNAGNPAGNLKLSEERAFAVFEFLGSLGISKARLSYKGFGESKPLVPNSTEEGRSLNRRTEFVIIAK